MKRTAAILAFVVFFAAAIAGTLRAQTDVVYYYRGDSARVVLPGQPLRISFTTNYVRSNPANATTVVRLYRVPVSVRVNWLLHSRYQLRKKDLASLELLQTLQNTGTLKDLNYEHVVDFGRQQNGEYFVSWEDEGSANAEVFDVGSLGSVWHATGNTLLVYAVDLRSMRHRSDVAYSIFRKDGSRSGLVVFDGLSWLHGKNPASDILYGRASDGSVTVQSIYSGQSNQAAGYVQTDRPIYRPGQRVYVRAILRNGFIGGYTIPHGEVRVIIRGPDGAAIYDHRRPLTEFGSVSAEVEIPQAAQLGQYQIGAGGANSSFSVEAYRKPEYLLTAKPLSEHIVSGDVASFDVDAKYFFGRPAAAMHIHYTAFRQPFFFPWYNPYSRFISDIIPYRQPEKIAEAETQTDANGHVRIDVPTKHLEFEDSLTLQVDGRDASGRTVSTQSSTQLVPADFRIDLSPDHWYAQLGTDVNVAVNAKDYDGHARPRVSLDVDITGTRWDYHTHDERKLPEQKDTIATDQDGKAVYRWHPQQAGSYQIRVTGKDARGHMATATLWFWVSSSNESWWYPNEQITLIPDKESYHQGEAAKILLTTPQSDADAVLIVSTDQINSARLIRVSAKPQTLVVQPPKDASVYRVVVEVPGSQGLQTGEATIKVLPPPRLLTVTISPDKAKYAPGDHARLKVHVHDLSGKPVRAELGIGVVDEALYAVQEDNSATAMAQFYDDRLTWLSSAASWYRVEPRLKTIGSVRMGATADSFAAPAPVGTPAPSAAPANAEKPRSYFPDTAYWKPDVVTDGAGNATISFAWPDSLTTWRANGVAVDMQTSVGAGKQDALVSKDFLVRLEMPRFLRRGDVSTFTGIVNGKAGAAGATLHLDAGDLLRSGSPDATVTYDSNLSGSAQWLVNPITSLGNRETTLSGTDGTLSDAMRLTIPIEAAGAAEHQRDAGEAHERNTVDFTLPQMYDPGNLQITLAPSVVASLIQNVQLLDIYPYYCTEQTMSAALPAVFVDRLLKRTGLPPPVDSPTTASIVTKAVARLRELQHEDGSWGWWESDESHPFMTAYALYGLAEFRKSGFAVAQSTIDRGVESLIAQMNSGNDDTLRFWGGRQPNSQWNTRAFMLYALADAAPARVDRARLAQTMSHAAELNPYALAVLGLAQHELGNVAAATQILSQLNAREVDDGAYTYWLGPTWEYAWEDDPIETTAYALRLNTALNPRSARIPKIVNFLRAQQRGNWWYTTKDTAAAVYAISETVAPQSQEFHPNEDVQVFAGERLVDRLHVTTPILDAKDATITIPAADFEHGGSVRIALTGSGMLYWSTDWTRYAPPYARKVVNASESILARLRAKPSAFSIDRRYTAKRWPWQVGDEITVDDSVRVTSDTDYVAIEDPFPAGVEYQPLQGQAGENWSGLQYFDDRAVFFADRLSANYPLHIQYTLRVTTPGTYTAAPPIAYAMYGPPVATVGQPDKVTVK